MVSQAERWLLEEKYGGEKSEGFFADCKRLAAGEPLGYVIGFVPFLGCTIWLDNHPLIPRPETEFWVEKAISRIRLPRGSTSGKRLQVLDLCAGSGCIGVAVGKHAPEAQVDFCEVDPRLLPTIEKNLAENLSVNRKVSRVVQSDLFENIPSEMYDFILTNPPYIDPAIDRAEPSVKAHEPHRALYGGEGGLELIERIISEAPHYLAPAGQLWIEHEPEQTALIHTRSAQHGFSATTHTDQYNVDRFSILVLQ